MLSSLQLLSSLHLFLVILFNVASAELATQNAKGAVTGGVLWKRLFNSRTIYFILWQDAVLGSAEADTAKTVLASKEKQENRKTHLTRQKHLLALMPWERHRPSLTFNFLISEGG